MIGWLRTLKPVVIGTMRPAVTGVSGLCVGLAIAYLLGLSFLPGLVAGVFFTGLSLVTRSVVVPLLSIGLGFSLLCISINLYGTTRSFPTIQGDHLVILFGLSLVVTAIGLASSLKPNFSYTESISTAVILLVGVLLRSRFPSSNGLAFQTLSTVGEDNAAWLQALADSSTRNGAVFGAPSLFGGGTGTGASLTIFRQTYASFSDQFVNGLGSNGFILLRGSLLLAVLSAALVTSGTVRLLARVPWYSRLISGATAGLLSYTLITGMSATGHFSAVLATFLVVTGVFAVLLLREATRFPTIAIGLTSVITIVTAGLSWFPLMPLAMSLTGWFALMFVGGTLYRLPSDRRRIVGALTTLFIGLLFIWLWRRFFSSVLDNLSWDYFTFSMSLSGGVQSISSLLAVSGLFAVVFVCGSRPENDVGVMQRIAGLTLPMGIVAYCVAIYLVSFLNAPYSPRYGATKLLYVTSAVSVPLIVFSATTIAARVRASKLVHISLGPLILATLTLFDPSRVFFAWPTSVELKANWAPAIVREVTQRPNRNVVCLNTTTDLGQDIWAYICSRMAGGLQGLSTAGPDGQGDFPVWTAANIYAIPPEQGAAAWDEAFYRNLTILVFDATRRDNGDPRQIAWLADVDWSLVRIIGPDGTVVKRAGSPVAELAP